MILNLAFCAAALVLVGLQPPPGAAAEVLRREQQRVDYLTTGKIDELAAMLSPTMSYTHSSAVLDGKDKFLEALRSGQVVYKTLKHHDLQARLITPDVGVINGLSDINVVINGKPTDVPVRFTIVYVRSKGQWLMESWHATRRPNP